MHIPTDSDFARSWLLLPLLEMVYAHFHLSGSLPLHRKDGKEIRIILRTFYVPDTLLGAFPILSFFSSLDEVKEKRQEVFIYLFIYFKDLFIYLQERECAHAQMWGGT